MEVDIKWSLYIIHLIGPYSSMDGKITCVINKISF